MKKVRTTERVERAIQHPEKTVTKSESLALKMGKIVKDDTGSGRWEVG